MLRSWYVRSSKDVYAQSLFCIGDLFTYSLCFVFGMLDLQITYSSCIGFGVMGFKEAAMPTMELVG